MLWAMGVMVVVGYTAGLRGDRTNRLPEDLLSHTGAWGRQGKLVPAYCWTPVKAGCNVSATEGLWAAENSTVSTAKGTTRVQPLSPHPPAK